MKQLMCKIIFLLILLNRGGIADAQKPSLLLPIGHNHVLNIAYVLNDNYVVTFNGEGLKLWDVSNGALVKNFSIPDKFKSIELAITNSNDNKNIIAITPEYVMTWNLLNESIIDTIKREELENFNIYELDSVKYNISDVDYYSLAMGTVYGSGTRVIADSTTNYEAVLIDSWTGDVITNFKGRAERLLSSQKTKFGTVLSVTDNECVIWDNKNGKTIDRFILNGANGKIEFSHDSTKVIVYGKEFCLLIDLEQSKVLHKIGSTSEIFSAGFLPIRNHSYISTNKKTVVWDNRSARVVQELEGYLLGGGMICAQKIRFLTRFNENLLEWRWDSEKWFKAHHVSMYDKSEQHHVDIAYSADASTIFINGDMLLHSIDSSDYEISIGFRNYGYHDLVNDRIVEFYADAVVSSPNPKVHLVYYRSILTDMNDYEERSVCLWNGEDKTDYSYGTFFIQKNITSVSSDAKYFIVDDSLCYDVKTLEFQYVKVPEKNCFTTTNGGKVSVVTDKNCNELYRRIQLKNGEWLVYDQHFRFDGPENARKALYLICDLERIELSQIKDALYVPNLASRIVAGLDVNYPRLEELDICGKLPLVEKNGNYEFTIIPRVYGLSHALLSVNGKVVQRFERNQLVRKADRYHIKIDSSFISTLLVPGEENTIELMAISLKNGTEIKSRGAKLKSFSTQQKNTKPTLYAVMIGVNDYKDDELDLNYPVSDAKKLSEVLKLSSQKLLGIDHVQMYNIRSDFESPEIFASPEKSGIEKAISEIGAQAKAQDIVLIFFAGHGVMKGTKDKKFTLLTAESKNDNYVGVSTDDLINWLSPEGPFKMKANKAILILDACNSGQASKEIAVMLARNNEEVERIRQVEDLKDKSGIFVLAASAPNQSAYEIPQFGQGLMTYCLLKTLKNNPSVLDDDKYLNIQKWFLESEEEMQIVVKQLGISQQAQPFGSSNIRIGEVDDTLRSRISLAQEKVLLICANASNTNLGFDDLDLKTKLNSKLRLNEQNSKIYSLAKGERLASVKINLMYSVNGDQLNCNLILVKDKKLIFRGLVVEKAAQKEQLLKQVINKINIELEKQDF